jgi:hypothetical protein
MLSPIVSADPSMAAEAMLVHPKPNDQNSEDSRPETLVRSDLEKREARLTRDIQIKIGQQLRAMYMDVVDQDVPDRFVEFLRQLDGETNNTGEE